MKPELEPMLAACDAALIIGDPALRLEPAELPYEVLDLGAEWVEWSGLPMVFAVWAGKKAHLTADVARAFQDSWQWGLGHIDEVIAAGAKERGYREEL
ncbi:MAG TPA: MqnA/MqnD/SBP family protein, partial [Bryobacteraceae bacterium]